MTRPSKRELDRRLEDLEEEDAEDAPALTDVLRDRGLMDPDDAEEDGEGSA
jgi:hypothetical protein